MAAVIGCSSISGRPLAGPPQATGGLLGIVGGRGVRVFPGEVLGCLVAACGAAGKELVGYVDVVVDVAQQPVVPVAVGLAAVSDELDGAADRREFLEQVCCLVGVALGRRRRVGDFGGVDASLGFAELSVRACLEGIVVCWFGEVDGELL